MHAVPAVCTTCCCNLRRCVLTALTLSLSRICLLFSLLLYVQLLFDLQAHSAPPLHTSLLHLSLLISVSSAAVSAATAHCSHVVSG